MELKVKLPSLTDDVRQLLGLAQQDDRGIEQLQALAELSQAFALSLDIEETLNNALQRIMAYLDASACSVFLLEGDELVCRASAGPSIITGMRLPLNRGIVGRVVATGEPQMVRDAHLDPDFNAAVDSKTGFYTRSMMCAPLQVGELRIGAIQVLNKRNENDLFAPQDLQILRVLASSTALAVHNARMAADLVEQRRIRQELDLARELQQRLLPAARPAPFPLVGVNVPAHEVSGDFYDFFSVDRRRYGHRVGFAIGDVSGKGINAALLMVRTTSLLRLLGRSGQPLGALMARVNAELCETGSQGMFVCALTGIYDPDTDDLTLCNAGFPPALLRRVDGSFESLPADAPPLGILPEVKFPVQQLKLQGGSLYMYTDGVTEARDSNGNSVEETGLRALITQHAALPADRRLAAIIESLSLLDLRDDTTLMILEGNAA